MPNTKNPASVVVQEAESSLDTGQSLPDTRFLADLQKWNQEILRQLRLEIRESSGTTDFLGSMIKEHEKTANLLQSRIAGAQKNGNERP